MHHAERHYSNRTGWLRAAVLGANDGIISNASLLVGLAAAQASQEEIVVAGVAALVAGAMSMAAGEYVSVSSQADTEKADLRREQHELTHNHEYELQELASIYRARGLQADLALEVAEQLMAHDALAAHARDELGLSEEMAAKPFVAALSSAASFIVGAILPLCVVFLLPVNIMVAGIVGVTLLALTLLGVLAAKAGGAPIFPSVRRVLFWGMMAMLITSLAGGLFTLGV